MDIFKNIPFLGSKQDDRLETLEDEAVARKARIDFHATSVRNGPVKFKDMTNGQVRRAQKRELARSSKRARRRQIKQHFAGEREAGLLRSKLQGALLVPTIGYVVSPERAVVDITWIVRHYAEGETGQQIDVTREVVMNALQAALNRYQALIGQPPTLIAEDYDLPVQVDA